MKVPAIIAWVLLVAGCTPSSDRACAPGVQQACACVGGGSGVQICKDDGSGFLACIGCPSTVDMSGADASRTDGGVPDLVSAADLAQGASDLSGQAPNDLSSSSDLASVAPDLASAAPDLASAGDLATQGGFIQKSFNGGVSAATLYSGDYNRDGKNDLLLVENGTIAGHVWLGNGDGTFQAGATVSGLAWRLFQGDVNRDGKIDLVDTQSHAVLGNGDGTFQAAGTVAWPNGVTVCGIGDFNRDGILDVVATQPGSSTSFTLDLALGVGDGTFGAPKATYTAAQSDGHACLTGDWNGDGNTDVAARGTAGLTNLSAFLGDGKSGFTAGESSSPGGIGQSPLAAADLDGNGMIDLVSGGSDNAYPNNGTLELSPNGHLASPSVLYVFPAGFFGFAAPGDLNGDGKRDLVAASGYLLNKGGGAFQPLVPLSPVASSTSGVSADFDGDGRDDIALSSQLNTITILLSRL